MEQRIIDSKKGDLYTHKDEISSLLRNEIVGRYYKQRGRIIASLTEDPEVAKALEIFSQKTKYSQILLPN